MKEILQRWIGVRPDLVTTDMLIEYVNEYSESNKEMIANVKAQIQVLRIEMQNLEQSVQQLINENIELRKNLPNRPVRQARNFTEFKSMLEEAQSDTRTIKST